MIRKVSLRVVLVSSCKEFCNFLEGRLCLFDLSEWISLNVLKFNVGFLFQILFNFADTIALSFRFMRQ